MDDDGFDSFYAAAHPRIRATLSVAWSQPDLAAEAADEAFVRAYASWDRVRRMAAPEGWVFRVALNAARRQHRRDRRRREAEQRAGTRADARVGAAGSPAADLELADRVADLPDRQRLAVILRYVADLREEDIAVAMGIRRGTVASLLTAAHRRLREEERERGGRPAPPGPPPATTDRSGCEAREGTRP